MEKFINSSMAVVILNKRLLIRAAITFALLGIVVYIVRMLFFYHVDTEYKDILNVMIGAILGLLPMTINYWFKRDDEDKKEESHERAIENKIDP